MAVKFWNPDFHKKSLKFNHSYSDAQQSCPIVSPKNGGTHSPEFKNQQGNFWHYVLFHGIIITAEYLPSKLNVQAD